MRTANLNWWKYCLKHFCVSNVGSTKYFSKTLIITNKICLFFRVNKSNFQALKTFFCFFFHSFFYFFLSSISIFISFAKTLLLNNYKLLSDVRSSMIFYWLFLEFHDKLLVGPSQLNVVCLDCPSNRVSQTQVYFARPKIFN